MIDTNNLQVFIDKKQILHDIDLHVSQGDFLGFIGPNGSGKSTLLKSIANILPHTGGQIKIDGQSITTYRQKQIAKKISYVAQDTSIQFDFKSEQIVMMGRHVHSSRFKMDQQTDLEIVWQAMRETNTLEFADRSVLDLSGGQRQLVLIAKALAQQTPILLLDEPISALDIYYQLHVLNLLKSLSEQGKTIIVVLHDLNLAARFCNKLALLEQGRIKKVGTSAEVLQEKLLQETYDVDTKVRLDELTNSITVTPLHVSQSIKNNLEE